MSRDRTWRRTAMRAATGVSRTLPDPVVRNLLVAASQRGAGPTIGLPDASHVVVVAPHPDDESLVAGGTISRLVRAGTRVTLVLATAGEASRAIGTSSALAAARTSEARAAARALGVDAVRELALPDGGLAAHLDHLADALAAVITQDPPDFVVTTWFGDAHRDHVAVNEALATLVDRFPDLPVWGGEMWTAVPATHLVDLDEVAVAAKAAAVAEHVTAASVFDLTARLAIDRYRSVQGLMGKGQAEAFVVLTVAQLADVLEAQTASRSPNTGSPR